MRHDFEFQQNVAILDADAVAGHAACEGAVAEDLGGDGNALTGGDDGFGGVFREDPRGCQHFEVAVSVDQLEILAEGADLSVEIKLVPGEVAEVRRELNAACAEAGRAAGGHCRVVTAADTEVVEQLQEVETKVVVIAKIELADDGGDVDLLRTHVHFSQQLVDTGDVLRGAGDHKAVRLRVPDELGLADDHGFRRTEVLRIVEHAAVGIGAGIHPGAATKVVVGVEGCRGSTVVAASGTGTR